MSDLFKGSKNDLYVKSFIDAMSGINKRVTALYTLNALVLAKTSMETAHKILTVYTLMASNCQNVSGPDINEMYPKAKASQLSVDRGDACPKHVDNSRTNAVKMTEPRPRRPLVRKPTLTVIDGDKA